MRYVQIKSGNKLHLVFEAEGYISQPICGIRAYKYRMTINVSLAYACRNCLKIYGINHGEKIKQEFFASL